MIKYQRQYIWDVEGHGTTKADSFTEVNSDLICIIISLLSKIFIISHGMLRIQLIDIHWFVLETPQIFI